MQIAVCLSRLPDPETVTVDPLTGIDLGRTLYILNPADEAALEMALRLRTASDSVTALTVGPVETEAVLRDAIAVGADHVLRVWEEDRSETRPPVTSLLLATAMRTEILPDLVLCGSRSLAGGSGGVAAMIAEHLDWPVATDIMDFRIDAGLVRFRRRLPRGARSEGEVSLPAVLAVEAGTVALRYASLPGMMKGKQATIPVRHLPELGLSPSDLRFPGSLVHVATPPYPRPREIFIPDSNLPPDERLAQITSAGVAHKSGRIVEGSPQELADAIFGFLRDHGFLDGAA